MSSFLADEHISLAVVKELNKTGIPTKHVNFDYGKGGVSDPDVLKLGKKEKSTVITNNTKDFTRLSSTEVRSSSGIWCVNSEAPKEQLRRVKLLAKQKSLSTKNARRGKLVDAHETTFTILDFTTNAKCEKSY